MCSADQDTKNNNTMANHSHNNDTNNDTNNNDKSGCCESVGESIDSGIRAFFYKLGKCVAFWPKWTMALSILVALCCGAGFVRFQTENDPNKLWVPQDTLAEAEGDAYRFYFPPGARFNTMIVQDKIPNANVLTKTNLIHVLAVHRQIVDTQIGNNNNTTGSTTSLVDLCLRAPSCASSVQDECRCFMSSIFKVWNYNAELLEQDVDYLRTIQTYGTRDDLERVLGGAVFDQDDNVVAAQALSLSYFLQPVPDEQDEDEATTTSTPANTSTTTTSEAESMQAQWEQEAFLGTLTSPNHTNVLHMDYLSARSFGDEFGGAITGDLALVQVSYIVVFIFLGASLGRLKCGKDSRWSMSIAALIMIALSTLAGFGIASAMGLFFGPVHSLLPFVLLGIGVDDAFVIVNAFDRERGTTRRQDEQDEALVERCARGLRRAGASITVTSLTDLVAFAISASSALPALASFCGYASICIAFLWMFASTFFTAALVLDEQRQRANRWDCFLCCFGGAKQKPGQDNDDNHDDDDNNEEEPANPEGLLSTYFRNYHAPAILSKPGKVVVLLAFAGLLAFGIFGAINLSVEDSQRNFIPQGSYVNDYIAAADEYFPQSGDITLFLVLENNNANNTVYKQRRALAALDERVSGKSQVPPFIAEPNTDETYRNVMTGMYQYMQREGTDEIGGVELGDDGWPTTEQDFLVALQQYASFFGPGSQYAQDVTFSDDTNDNGTNETQQPLDAIRVQLEYVKMTKLQRNGDVIDDANMQIQAMDATREMVDSWTDLPPAFPYSATFISIEGFKIIRHELFFNVGLAIAAVAIIVLATVASFVTAALITFCVGCCIVDILGMMYAFGIVIDSVSVINIVLAVGLSVDYSAHVGHCFMVKGGPNKDRRATEALADIGSAVLSGATSTFLAVAVLLASSSYVFNILSIQFAITVILGVLHGLILLPVLLALLGPKPFSAAEPLEEESEDGGNKAAAVLNAKPSVVRNTSQESSAEYDDAETNNEEEPAAPTMVENVWQEVLA